MATDMAMVMGTDIIKKGKKPFFIMFFMISLCE